MYSFMFIIIMYMYSFQHELLYQPFSIVPLPWYSRTGVPVVSRTVWTTIVRVGVPDYPPNGNCVRLCPISAELLPRFCLDVPLLPQKRQLARPKKSEERRGCRKREDEDEETTAEAENPTPEIGHNRTQWDRMSIGHTLYLFYSWVARTNM